MRLFWRPIMKSEGANRSQLNFVPLAAATIALMIIGGLLLGQQLAPREIPQKTVSSPGPSGYLSPISPQTNRSTALERNFMSVASCCALTTILRFRTPPIRPSLKSEVQRATPSLRAPPELSTAPSGSPGISRQLSRRRVYPPNFPPFIRGCACGAQVRYPNLPGSAP